MDCESFCHPGRRPATAPDGNGGVLTEIKHLAQGRKSLCQSLRRRRPHCGLGLAMLRPALIFLLVSIVAGLFGFWLGSDLFASAFRLLSGIFIVLFFVTLGTSTEGNVRP
jgi:uncharacterized membrane protein YtjA (UPF0391 family)